MANSPASQVATGRIRLDVTRFRADAQQIVQTAKAAAQNTANAFTQTTAKTTQAAKTAVQATAGAFIQAGNSIKRFGDNFKQVNAAIERSQGYLLAWSAAAAGLVFAGLRSADSLELLNVRFVELTGSQEEATRQMEQIAQAARRVGVPVRQAQRDFSGLIPAVRDAGGSIEEYIGLSLRLSTLNRTEGLSGSIFAIREALSSGGTDLVSLAERFNLPRAQLRALIAETGDFAEALDIVLNRQGATQAAADAQSRSLGALGAQIRDNLTQILERTFTPALETARDVLRGLNDLLAATPDWVIQAVAGFILIGGSLAGIALAINKVTEAFIALKALALATGGALGKAFPVIGTAASGLASRVGGLASRAAVTGGALAVGTGAGLAIAQGIGRVTGNEEMANVTLERVIGTAKGAIVLLFKLLLDIIKPFATIIVGLVNIFRSFGDGLTIIFSHIKQAFAGLIAIVGTVVEAIGNIVGQGQAGADLRREGERIFREALAEREAAASSAGQRILGSGEAVDRATNDVLRAVRDILIPPDATVETITGRVSSRLGAALNGALDDFRAGLVDIMAARGDALAAQFDDLVAFRQDLNELREFGDTETIQARVDSLERERDAILELTPLLEQQAVYSEDAANKLAEYNQRVIEISEQLPQLTEALQAATARTVRDINAELQDAIVKAESDRATALRALAKTTAKELRDLDQEVADKRLALLTRQAEIEAEYNEAEAKATEEHRRRLLDIERQFNQDAQLAASQLDAAGVAAAINRRAEDIRQADEARADAQQTNRERLTDAQAALLQERADVQAYYLQRRADIVTAQAEELAQIQAGYAQRIADAQTAAAQERAQAALNLQNQIADVRRAGEIERQVRQSMLDQFIADAQLAFTRLIQQGRDTISSLVSTIIPSTPAGDLARTAIGAGVGALLPSIPATTLAPTFNISGVTNPLEIAELIRRELVRLAGGA